MSYEPKVLWRAVHESGVLYLIRSAQNALSILCLSYLNSVFKGASQLRKKAFLNLMLNIAICLKKCKHLIMYACCKDLKRYALESYRPKIRRIRRIVLSLYKNCTCFFPCIGISPDCQMILNTAVIYERR